MYGSGRLLRSVVTIVVDERTVDEAGVEEMGCVDAKSAVVS